MYTVFIYLTILQIFNGPRHVIETHGLLIRNVQQSDDGDYTCRAAVSDTGELAERNIRVEVHIKPQVQELPKEMKANEGESFRVKCNATAKPEAKFTWIRNLDQQNLDNADRFFIDPISGVLQITRVDAFDYGNYTCRAENSAGFSESQMLLRVTVRPRIHELLNTTNALDKDAVLFCKASGRPPPEVSFKRWGTPDSELLVPGLQVSDDRITLEQGFDSVRGEANATMRISNSLRSDDGLYECVAINEAGPAYKTGHITVEFPPSFEHMKSLPPVFTWDEKIANLSCLAESIPNATIEWRWNNRRVIELQDMNLQVVNAAPRSDLLVKPSDRRYYSEYKCIATNRHGQAEHTMVLRQATIPNAVPSAKPRLVTATSITFEIIPPEYEFGLPLLAILCQFKEEFQIDWRMAANRTWSLDSLYAVEGLRPQTSYVFRFAARNVVGTSVWSTQVTQSTPRRSAPEEPRALHTADNNGEDGSDPVVRSAYADHFELRWTIPNDNGERITGYEISYCPVSIL